MIISYFFNFVNSDTVKLSQNEFFAHGKIGPDFSRITVLFDGDERNKEQLVDQLYKLPDVCSIKEFDREESISRELLLIKIKNELENRHEVLSAIQIFGSEPEIMAEAAKRISDMGIADILDINMGMNGIDEKDMMLQSIYEVTTTVDCPLCIDSSYVDVIEAALRIYPGRALINSISLETEKIEKLLPIAKKYGAMFNFSSTFVKKFIFLIYQKL